MNKFLNNTRSTENEIPVSRKIRNTIIILCLRSVYKELHADHETGAADNK